MTLEILSDSNTTCVQHDKDLTEQIIAKLTPRYPVARFRFRGRKASAILTSQPYIVIVQCPGGPGGVHDLTLQGTYSLRRN